MIHILAEILVSDQEKFMEVFPATGAEMRKKHGCLSSQVFCPSDAPGHLVLLLAWESKERYQAFLSDPDVQRTMQSGSTHGVVKVTFLDRIGEYPF